MAAIVRLKRRITDEPPETILVSCSKKAKCEEEKKTENVEENVTTQVLKFAGTVPDKNEEISKHIRNAIRKEKLEREYKRHVGSDLSAQNRILKKINSNKNRYNIVSQFRTKQLDKIDELDNEEAEASKKEAAEAIEKREKLFCLYDMEQENMACNLIPEEEIVTCNSVPMIKEKVLSPMNDIDKSYVYDLYYINQPHFNYSWLEDITCVDVYRQDNIFLADEFSDPEDVYEDDDDDSNDENNWRNDYPDEDPHFYDPVKFDESEDYPKEDQFSLVKSDDDDDDLAAKLERCFLGKDEDEEDEGTDLEERHKYEECSQYSWAYPTHTSYENYMERVRRELSDT